MAGIAKEILPLESGIRRGIPPGRMGGAFFGLSAHNVTV
jgi:hypothetical protein